MRRAVWVGLFAVVIAAGTAGAEDTKKTQLILGLASQDLVSVNAKFQEDPPTILIQFPANRVTATLPEEAVVGQGAIQSLEAVYAGASSPGARWLQELRVHLLGAYPYEVRSESGKIIVEVSHPAEVAGQTVEVGLTGGTIISGAPPQAFSERFRAMEEALRRAMPQPAAVSSAPAAASIQAPAEPASAISTTSPRKPFTPGSPLWNWFFASILAGVVAGWWLWRSGRWQALAARWHFLKPQTSAPSNRIAPEVRIVDQLVWRAFERKGFQLLQMLELQEPPSLMRLMTNGGHKAALLCMGEGVFFEKTVVEEFKKAMRDVSVPEGFIVASGSFTVPAQRLAKEHGIALIGREQLIELLSEGAVSEHFTAQVRQLHEQVQRATITLEEYAQQLEELRRQRNESTWFLGEERAKSASLQAQLDELTRQVGEWQAQATQWQEAAELTRKQWEESQWYLGEAKAAITHLEGQMESLQQSYAQLEVRHQELTTKLQDTERQRDESAWFLGESRSACEMLKRETQQLSDQLRMTQDSLETTKRRVEHYRRLYEGDERRKTVRVHRTDVSVQVQGIDGAVLFEGPPRDLSITGIGLDLPAPSAAADGSEPPAQTPDSLHLRLSIPGSSEPIHVNAKTVWRRPVDGETTRGSGHEFIELSPDDLDRLQRAIAQLA